MSLLSFPDVVRMLFLMGILGWLRTRHRHERVGTWLLGLAFILLQTVVVSISEAAGHASSWSDSVGFDAYLLAGVTFGYAARRDRIVTRERLPFFLLPVLPMLSLSSLVGFAVVSPLPYTLIATVSLVAGVGYLSFAYSDRPRFRAAMMVAHVMIWLPMVGFGITGQPYAVLCWGLGCLYLLVAELFRSRIRRGCIGGLVLFIAFVAWGLCFMLYPIVRQHAVMDALFEEIWKMQRFVVILGMLLMLLEDETERRKAEAMHDVLTGLPNRRLYADRLQQAIERSRRDGKLVGLFLIDLNGFKRINDRHGHRMGDQVLERVADRLRITVRTADTLARCGGDEFWIVVNDIANLSDCAIIVDKLRATLALVELPAGCALPVSGSIGFAVFPVDGVDARALEELADKRMYADKGEAARKLAASIPESHTISPENHPASPEPRALPSVAAATSMASPLTETS